MYTLNGNKFSLSIDEEGRLCSFMNTRTTREYVKIPGEMWKLIYREGIRTERPIYGTGQSFTVLQSEDSLTLRYDKLKCDDRVLDVTLELCFKMRGDFLDVTTKMENHSDVPLIEWQCTPLSGVQTLGGDSEDYMVWPNKLGRKVVRPAFTHLSANSPFRTYEMPEQQHTDLNILYPGEGSMQWFDWCNDQEGFYIGCHDESHQTICMRAERTIKENTLRLGVIKYPFCDPGEIWESAPIVITLHEGDWHKGAEIYRGWLESTGWKAPVIPEWASEFQGWLRVIMKPHHCDVNWDYSQIPMLFDEAQAAGMNTLFLLGWEEGGFARMWPDFKVAEDMGGKEMLQKGIEYVHSKGGRVILFLSYFLIDHQSNFYKQEGGDKCTIKTIWGEDLPFSETYCGEATYRKLCNPPMPMYAACPSVPAWQDKMLEVTKYCMDLGADGVLYDLGGRNASFCFAKDHPHKKPSHSHCDKDKKYAELRELVKSYGDDKITLMEYNVDIYGQHMDIVHSSFTSHMNPSYFSPMYRYTFPEIVMTNREMALDETDYREKINFTFIMGFAFDLSIFRCLGLPSEIPEYVKYMKQALALRQENAEYLIKGKFVDTVGFTVDQPLVRCIGYRAEDGSLGVACWNTAAESTTVTICTDEGKSQMVSMEPNSIAFVAFK